MDDEVLTREVLDDLAAKRGNSRRIPYAGQDCLWTYGSPDGETLLALIIPYEQILGPVREQVGMVREAVREQAMTTGYLLLGVALLVALATLAFARTIARPVTALATAAGQLAAGDLSARVDISSRDEFGQVAAVFNQVGPTVRENQRVRESLAKAEELLLREKNRLQGERIRGLTNLAQSVAHQVRNPVLAIGGFAHRLDTQLTQARLESSYPRIILEQASRLERVVAATSQLASLPQAKPVPASLVQAVEAARRQAQERGQALGKTITWQGECAPSLVWADPELLAQALAQVLVNCLEFTPGPLVTIGLGQRQDGPWVLLEVWDDGPGVAPGDLAYVFDPFFTSKADGTGLGLTLARQIVLEMEGDLVMASPGPLGGAQVTFRLKPPPAEAGPA
jgi:signal transduction histidine kinase